MKFSAEESSGIKIVNNQELCCQKRDGEAPFRVSTDETGFPSRNRRFSRCLKINKNDVEQSHLKLRLERQGLTLLFMTMITLWILLMEQIMPFTKPLIQQPVLQLVQQKFTQFYKFKISYDQLQLT